MQVRELEREIGAELVERRPGDIALIGAGLEVAERAEQILSATRDLVDFARHRDVVSGPLKPGIVPTLALTSYRGSRRSYRRNIRNSGWKCAKPRPRPCSTIEPRRTRYCHAGPTGGRRRRRDHAAVRGCVLLAVPTSYKTSAHGRVRIKDVDQRRLILLEEGTARGIKCWPSVPHPGATLRPASGPCR